MKKNLFLYIPGVLLLANLVSSAVTWVHAGSGKTPSTTDATAQTPAPDGSIVIRTTQEHDFPSLATVSLQQAIQTALAQTPGGLLKAEIAEQHGTLVHHIEIVGADKTITEFTIDAGTGAILATAVDHADDDHRKGAADDDDDE